MGPVTGSGRDTRHRRDTQCRHRAYLGPWCKTAGLDGSTISGTKKWGDGKGSEYTDGELYFECMGCRTVLDKPPAHVEKHVGNLALLDDVDVETAIREAKTSKVKWYVRLRRGRAWVGSRRTAACLGAPRR